MSHYSASPIKLHSGEKQVRRIMESAGLSPRQAREPQVFSDVGSSVAGHCIGWYNREIGGMPPTIFLRDDAGEDTLVHELAHHLQPAPQGEPKLVGDADDYAAYRWQHHERIAFAVQAFWTLAQRDTRWWRALESFPRAGLDALEYMVFPGRRKRAPIHAPGRKARLAANQALRAAGLMEGR